MPTGETPRKVVDLAVTKRHGLALFSDGTVCGMGNNVCGQVDVGGWHDIVAIATSAVHSVGLCSDGTVVVAGSLGWKPGDVDDAGHVTGWHDIVAVATGQWHVVGLRRNGTVVAVGYNNMDGPLNTSAWTDVVAIDAGLGYTVGLRRDGTVLVTGGHLFGGCDVGTWTDIVQISAGLKHVVGLRSDGHVLVATCVRTGSPGCDGFPEWRCEREWKNVVSVRAGNASVLGLFADGTAAIDVYERGIARIAADALPAGIEHVYLWEDEHWMPLDYLYWYAYDDTANVLGVLSDGQVFYGWYLWVAEEWFELDACRLDEIWDEDETTPSLAGRITLGNLEAVTGELVLPDVYDPASYNRFSFSNCDEGYPRYHGRLMDERWHDHVVLTHEGGLWHARDYMETWPFTNYCDVTGDTEREALDALTIARFVHPRNYVSYYEDFIDWGWA